MRILLVEDDVLIGDGVSAGLKLCGHAVDWVREGESALRALFDHDYDACILDLGLPGRDGLSVLQSVRERGLRVPMLILTARDSREDKIAGLDCGADDYLTKPFDLDELLARLRALVRRAQAVFVNVRLGCDVRQWLQPRQQRRQVRQLHHLQCGRAGLGGGAGVGDQQVVERGGSGGGHRGEVGGHDGQQGGRRDYPSPDSGSIASP